ncbi:MAG: tol-pal system protein YbgF [Rhodoferax sp.]|nr:tol-pal system protein YbgF [Rhodoferax sp.]
MHRSFRMPYRCVAGLLLLAASSLSQAGLFEDDEARKAILDLRQRLEAVRQSVDGVQRNVDTVQRSVDAARQDQDAARRAATQALEALGQQQQQALTQASEEAAVLRRGLLELQGQIGQLRAELAELRGLKEQLSRDLAESQRRQKDLAQGLDDRFRALEPVKVSVDGAEFMAEQAERRAFENALALFRKGDFSASQNAFVDLLTRYPQSGYAASSLFWLGNAQYATRDYKEAVVNFRALIGRSPNHPRAPEAVLSIANCQIELKDTKGARKTLDDLVKAYPQSEAATAARDRLARLK